MIKIRSLL